MAIWLPSGTPAELCKPSDGRVPSRGLVLIPDIMGLRPLMTGHAQRLADEQNWVVCTFELWPGREELTLAERLELAGSLSDERVLSDAVAAAEVCGIEPVGVTGFCIGGMHTFKAAGTGRFDRAAAFYGMIRVPPQWRGAGHGEPLEALASADRCPTMAIIGVEDQFTPPEDVARLEAAGVDVVSYPGADHGFVHDPDRPAHRADDAADAWRRVVTFFAG